MVHLTARVWIADIRKFLSQLGAKLPDVPQIIACCEVIDDIVSKTGAIVASCNINNDMSPSLEFELTGGGIRNAYVVRITYAMMQLLVKDRRAPAEQFVMLKDFNSRGGVKSIADTFSNAMTQ